MPVSQQQFFSYDGLQKLLVHAQTVGRVLRLCDWDGGPGLILRHDVDFSIGPAHELAVVEAATGVRSSFFFLITYPHYNVLAATSRSMIRDIAEMGFEVGLHFDPSVYPNHNDDQLTQRVREEADVLALASGTPVESVSLHNPSATGRYPLFEGFRNAYEPNIFEGRYLSDSQRRFGGDVYAFVNRARGDIIQLLLHPMHFSKTGGGYSELFWDYAVQLLETIDADWRDNNAYVESVAESLLALVRGERPSEDA